MNLDEFYKQTFEQETKKIEEQVKNPSDNPDILKLKIGGTYRLRLLPDKANGTFMKDYEDVGFNSRSDGSYIYLGLSPRFAGLKKDVVANTQWKSWKAVEKLEDKAIRGEAMQLIPKRKKLVNVYVVSDSLNPENNGTNKVLRFNAPIDRKTKAPSGEIFTKIYDAFIGDKRDRFGRRVIDLGKDGVTFEITVVKKATPMGDLPNYKCDFSFPEAVPGLDTEEKIQAVLDKTFDLAKFLPDLKTQEELTAILDEHWNCVPKTEENSSGEPSSDNHDSSSDGSSGDTFEWNETDDVRF